MTIRLVVLCAIAIAGMTIAHVPSAAALTMQECSAKYKAAQAAGTLKGQSWADFRKAECGSDASAAPAPAATPAAKPAPAASAARKPEPAASAAVFPTAVSAKYAKETAGKARMHTCLDQYNANKANNANGGMKWIEKGGGYYSECSKRLKS